MYACICTAVTVDQIESAIDAGADTIEELGAITSAGTTCHTCHDHLDEIIEQRCGGCPLSRLAVA